MTRPTSKGRPGVALVTGANRGLGLETSKQLARLGCRVALTGRDALRVQSAMRTLEAAEDQLMAVRMDVREPASIAEAQQRIVQQLGPVDILVNNAAVLVHEDSEVLSIPSQGFHETFATNLFGVIEVCRVFVPSMAERGYGRVVNVSSGAGQLSEMSTYAPAYSLSKAALNAFTRILASTYRDRGVLVNAVDPGWVRTDMGGARAPRSVEQGVDTIVWLATLESNGPTGGFFRDRRAIRW